MPETPAEAKRFFQIRVGEIEGRAIVRDAQDRDTSIVVETEPYLLELVGESAPCGLSGARRDRRVNAGKK
jgi:hypothetical protein